MRLAERTERCQFHHAPDLTLEEHGQDNDVAWTRLAQAGGDAEIILWHVGQQDLFSFQGTLAN